MKKIMFISAANSIHTVKWVNALSEFFEIHLVFCSNHEEKENKIDKKIFLHKLKYSSPFGYYLNVLELKKIYNEVNPDLVNTHYASGYGTLVRISGIKCNLMSIWGSDILDFPNRSKINYCILKKNLEYPTFISSTSNVMMERCEVLYPNIKKKFFIVPFGVDLNLFRKREKVENNNTKVLIGIVKSLKSVYGIEYAIEAMKILKDKENKYIMEIYGDGDEKEKLQKLINEYQLNDSVILKGKVENKEVPKILTKFDIFCMTSIEESFGVALIEAMAVGVPVIASNANGFLEVTNNGETAVIFEKKNPIELANKIEGLINDKKKMKELSIAGRKRVEEYYNFEDNVINMKNIYEEIMEEKSRN